MQALPRVFHRLVSHCLIAKTTSMPDFCQPVAIWEEFKNVRTKRYDLRYPWKFDVVFRTAKYKRWISPLLNSTENIIPADVSTDESENFFSAKCVPFSRIRVVIISITSRRRFFTAFIRRNSRIKFKNFILKNKSSTAPMLCYLRLVYKIWKYLIF